MKAINIILDESNPTKPIFVDMVNDAGTSIDIGQRTYKDGLASLRITVADIDLAVPDLDGNETICEINNLHNSLAIDGYKLCPGCNVSLR